MCTSKRRGVSDDGDEGDIWADSSEDGQGELDREATARHQRFYNAGYREGMEEGKEQTLQGGFNLGFREGAAAGFEWGLLRGAVKTLAALDGQAAATRGLRDQIQELQAAAEVDPRAAMLAIFRHVLSSPPTPPPHPPHEPQDASLPSWGASPRQGALHCGDHGPARSEASQNLTPELLSASASGDPGVGPSSSSSRGIGGAVTDFEVEQLAGVFAGVAGMSPLSLSSSAAAAAGRESAGTTAAGAGVSARGRSKAEFEEPGGSGDAATDTALRPGRVGTDGAAMSAPDRAATAASSGGPTVPAALGHRYRGPAVPVALPPDAAALHLPDMVVLMGALRGRLEDLGFPVDRAVPPPPAAPVAARPSAS